MTGLAVYEDWFADTNEGRDFRAAVHQARVDGERTIELAQSPTGIPPVGAMELLRSDPLTQGQRVFEMACVSCHQPASGNGEFEDPAQAPELVDLADPRNVGFASREWTRSILMDFAGHLQSLSNITVENGATEERAEAAAAVLEGDMAYWSEGNVEVLQNEENVADVDALIEFLYAQSGRADALPLDDAQVQRGRQIFIDGEMAAESIEACSYCHVLVAVGDEEALGVEDDRYGEGPDLTGYGNATWLRDFISDPSAYYGGNNAMPAFADQLSEAELDFLVRWMVGDYYSSDEHASDPEPVEAADEPVEAAE